MTDKRVDELDQGPNILETERLALRRLSDADAEFVLELLNEPSFIHFIGDKGVRNLADARNYLQNGPCKSYVEHGYGLYLTVLKKDGARAGMCGLLKREELPDPDIGFAFLPAYRMQGYAAEAAAAVLQYAREQLGMSRIIAITAADNRNSIGLLQKIGLSFERMIRLSEDADEIKLFATDT